MSRTVEVALPVIAIGLCMCSSGCGPMGRKSPSQVVIAAYMAANEGEYSEAEKHCSSELISALKGELAALGGGSKGLWDKITRDGTIERIEILKEEVRGEGAKVYFRIHFRNGQSDEDDSSLIREGGQWKLTIG